MSKESMPNNLNELNEVLPDIDKPVIQSLELPANEETDKLLKIVFKSNVGQYIATAEDLKRIKAEQSADIFKKILAVVINHKLPGGELEIAKIQDLIEIKNEFADEFNIDAFCEERCENFLKTAQGSPDHIIFLVKVAKFRQQTNQIIDIDYQRLSKTYSEPIKQAYRFHLVNNNQDLADLIKQELGQGISFSEYDQSKNIPATLRDAILANQLDKTSSMLIKTHDSVKKDRDALAKYSRVDSRNVIRLFRGAPALLAMLSLKNKDGKQFADDILQYGNEISAQGIISNDKIHSAVHKIFDEGCNLKMFFTLAPFLHKKLIKLGLSPKQAIETEINWAKSATDNYKPVNDYTKIILLPGLEKLNEAYTSENSAKFLNPPGYFLAKPGDASFKFSEQEAERLIKELPEIFGEFTEEEFKKSGF